MTAAFSKSMSDTNLPSSEPMKELLSMYGPSIRVNTGILLTIHFKYSTTIPPSMMKSLPPKESPHDPAHPIRNHRIRAVRGWPAQEQRQNAHCAEGHHPVGRTPRINKGRPHHPRS